MNHGGNDDREIPCSHKQPHTHKAQGQIASPIYQKSHLYSLCNPTTLPSFEAAQSASMRHLTVLRIGGRREPSHARARQRLKGKRSATDHYLSSIALPGLSRSGPPGRVRKLEKPPRYAETCSSLSC